MKKTDQKLEADVAKIQQISIIPNILNVICQTTKMGFAAVARVTEERWIACTVLDNVNFGLKAGDELKIETTICHEIRESRELVVFDNADEDPDYKNHHTPKIYGLKSYISIPIFTKAGNFFGTLCAIDPEPRQVNNPVVIDTFRLFAELIAFHIEAIDQLQLANDALNEERRLAQQQEKKIEKRDLHLALKKEQLLRSDSRLNTSINELAKRDESIVKLNEELSALAYISSHDLQEPIRKIRMFSNLIYDAERDVLSEKSREYLQKINTSATRLQSLIKDLLAYNTNSGTKNIKIDTDLETIIKEAVNDLKAEIDNAKATVTINGSGNARVIPHQVRLLVFNLISNSIQFAKSGRKPHINIYFSIVEGSETGIDKLDISAKYCHLRLSDNGIGFDQKFSKKIFELFERLNDDHKIEGTGIGLAIVKKIVDNHNGYITADGEEDNGATFNVFLPL
jgi:signal transduction histidine kinase